MTMITMNNGMSWSRIRVESGECEGVCHLNIDMENEEVYSEEKSMGIIIVHGNVGKYLNNKFSDVYISIDNGNSC